MISIKPKFKSGFTLLMAVVITSVLFIISVGIINIAIKQAELSTYARDSQRAFYAADSALECALFWDLKNPSLVSAFDPASNDSISCNGQTPGISGRSGGQSQFTITYNDIGCTRAEVEVIKRGISPKTIIRTFGYSSCSTTDPRMVQRTISVRY